MRRALAPPPPLPAAASEQQGGGASVGDCQGLWSHAAAATYEAQNHTSPPRLLTFQLMACQRMGNAHTIATQPPLPSTPALHPALTQAVDLLVDGGHQPVKEAGVERLGQSISRLSRLACTRQAQRRGSTCRMW